MKMFNMTDAIFYLDLVQVSSGIRFVLLATRAYLQCFTLAGEPQLTPVYDHDD